MLRLVVRLVLILVVLLIALVLTRPAAFHVERSISIGAPAEAAYGAVADFHRWTGWSPWEGRDPGMVRTYEGTPGESGATYHWAGDDRVGEGRMTLREALPGRRLEIQLDFIKPFPSSNTTRFTFEPEGAGTRVTWTLDGRHDLMGKAMSLFASMDKLVGPDFEQGLEGLRRVAEGAPAPADSAAAAAP